MTQDASDMNRSREGEEPEICIEPLSMNHIPEISQIFKESFGSKRLLGCIPLAESAAEMTRRYETYPSAKLALGAVAVMSGKVVGSVQMTRTGLPIFPAGLHVCRDDEMYIETLAVSATARGKGVGTMLLEWCERTARTLQDIRILSLSVLNGNRAIGLYERFGFQPVETDCVEDCCAVLIVFCCFGHPYGCCNSAWGAKDMKKVLQ